MGRVRADVTGAVLWAVFKELVIEPKEYKAFNMALDRLRDDPRVTVRLGTPISGYGQESRNRAARQRIPHRIQVDQNGVEHVQVWFPFAWTSNLCASLKRFRS